MTAPRSGLLALAGILTALAIAGGVAEAAPNRGAAKAFGITRHDVRPAPTVRRDYRQTDPAATRVRATPGEATRVPARPGASTAERVPARPGKPTAERVPAKPGATRVRATPGTPRPEQKVVRDHRPRIAAPSRGSARQRDR